MTKNPEVILNITYSHEVCFVCVYGKDVSLPKFSQLKDQVSEKQYATDSQKYWKLVDVQSVLHFSTESH